jgi:hypothetical protein
VSLDARIGLTLATAIALIAIGVAGCGDVNAALQRLVEARQVSADLLVEFTKAADAANQAVMADTDEASVTYAHEAEAAKHAVQHDVDTLDPMLRRLAYADESQVLQEFVSRFAAYDELDRRVLDLAVENTNLKAQRLSFGPAQDAADAFRDALAAAKASDPRDRWRVEALTAAAVASVREIQALQAPHIAEADDAAMTRVEQRMTTAEAGVRRAIETLATVVDQPSQASIHSATADLDHFMDLNAQIIALSRRNTNVRSLALSLSQKPALTAACEDALRRLQAALARRGYGPGTWK